MNAQKDSKKNGRKGDVVPDVEAWWPQGFKGIFLRVEKDPSEPETLRDLLVLVSVDVPVADLLKRTLRERVHAEVWAGRVHVHASDNTTVRVPPKPAWLDAYPAVPLHQGKGIW